MIKIFKDEHKQVLRADFYGEYEAVLFLETEDEEAIGFLKGGKVIVPIVEIGDYVDVIEHNFTDVATIIKKTETILEQNRGKLLYIGTEKIKKTDKVLNIKLEKTETMVIDIKECYEFSYLSNLNETVFYVRTSSKEVLEIRQIHLTSYSTVSFLRRIDDTPFDVEVLYKKRISNKKKKGITDMKGLDVLKY